MKALLEICLKKGLLYCFFGRGTLCPIFSFFQKIAEFFIIRYAP